MEQLNDVRLQVRHRITMHPSNPHEMHPMPHANKTQRNAYSLATKCKSDAKGKGRKNGLTQWTNRPPHPAQHVRCFLSGCSHGTSNTFKTFILTVIRDFTDLSSKRFLKSVCSNPWLENDLSTAASDGFIPCRTVATLPKWGTSIIAANQNSKGVTSPWGMASDPLRLIQRPNSTLSFC